MIKVFAVDPSTPSTLRSPERFINTFGMQHGRWIADYPVTQWIKMMLGVPDLPVLTRKHLEAVATHLVTGDGSKGFIRVPGLRYDDTDTWINNAIDQAWAFDEIVTDENCGTAGVMSVDECRDWRVDAGISVERNATAYARSLSTVLIHAKEVRLIDPYFCVVDEYEATCTPADRYLNVIDALLREVSRSVQKQPAIEIHLSKRIQDHSREQFEQYCEDYLAPRLPKGWSVSLIRWSQIWGKDRLHDRYVLTNLGGIAVPGGLDEGKGDHKHTTSFNIMGKQEWVERWHAYDYRQQTSSSHSYRLIDTLEVTSTK